jgi:hypothetical protein
MPFLNRFLLQVITVPVPPHPYTFSHFTRRDQLCSQTSWSRDVGRAN